jgi:hypothetical protein
LGGFQFKRKGTFMKRKRVFVKRKRGDKGSFSHENKQHKDSGKPRCPWVRGSVGGPSALGRLPVAENKNPAPDKWVDRGARITDGVPRPEPGNSPIRAVAFAKCPRVGMERTLPDS